MTNLDIATHEIVSFADLEALAGARGPCITIATPILNPLEIKPRLKKATLGVQRKLSDLGVDTGFTRHLLEPIHNIAVAAGNDDIWANALILFRSPEVFRYYWLHGGSNEFLAVADQFHIRPLLSVIARPQKIYLLCLSRRNTQLFLCTLHAAQEVALPPGFPRSLDDWIHARQPDHVLDNRSTAGPSVGSMKGVMFGTNTDREREGEYIAHFLKEIDKGIHRILRSGTAPLVLAGVEYEVAAYRRLNTYPQLLDQAIHVSPDGLSHRALHERALKIAMNSRSALLEKAMADFQRWRDTLRISSDLRETAKAAAERRVADLLVSEFVNDKLTQDDPKDDILNAVALQTVRYGGRAFAVSPTEMPLQAEVAAVLRY